MKLQVYFSPDLLATFPKESSYQIRQHREEEKRKEIETATAAMWRAYKKKQKKVTLREREEFRKWCRRVKATLKLGKVVHIRGWD